MIRPVRPDGTIETGGVFVPVLRRRVLERLASAAMQRIVLVIAPAGYGKSVAVRQFLDTLDEPCVRYDVLPDNGGLLGFLRGFADALSEVAPDARATLAGAYEKNASSDSPGADLAMWMHAHLKGYRGIIAIDDLHVAQEDREVTRFLASLIERTKGRVQWVIASRTALGLPIGTWLAYGESDLAIDEHDLKFSIEEARDAARAFRLGVRDEELYELLNLTDGWATAMSFALRSSTRSVDLRNISTMTREMIYRYLAEQVYNALNDEERDFLETAALLPEIDTEVLVAAGYDRAKRMVEGLRQRVAFIQDTDTDELYRLHDLFREFLLHQLRLRGNERLKDRALRLGSVLEKTRRTVDALRLYSESKALDDVTRVLEASGYALISKGFLDDVEAALLRCSGAAFDERAVVVGVKGLVEVFRGRVRQGLLLLRRAAAMLGPSALRDDLVLQLAISEIYLGIEPTGVLDAMVDDNAVEANVRAEALALMAVSLARLGSIEDAKLKIRQVELTLGEISDEEVRARLHLRIGSVYFSCGEYAVSRDHLLAAAEMGSGCSLWAIAAKAYNNLSLGVFLSEADAALALWYAQQAAASSGRAGDYLELQNALIIMLSLETRRGNADRASQIERQLADLRMDDPLRANFIASSQAHRHAWSRHFADAHRLFGAILDRQPYYADRFIVRASYALCLALDGMAKQSAMVVESTIEMLAQTRPAQSPNVELVDVGCLMLVLAEALTGRLTMAQRVLKKVKISRHPAVLALSKITEELLRAVKSSSYEPRDINGDLDVVREAGFGGYGRYFAIAIEAIEQRREPQEVVSLTPSEIRIIRDLAAGLSPKEIAGEMGRSVYTVQTHIQNLIEKLGCHGRAEAIAAAKKLGYVEVVR